MYPGVHSTVWLGPGSDLVGSDWIRSGSIGSGRTRLGSVASKGNSGEVLNFWDFEFLVAWSTPFSPKYFGKSDKEYKKQIIASRAIQTIPF
jgi:hypothetical protein